MRVYLFHKHISEQKSTFCVIFAKIFTRHFCIDQLQIYLIFVALCVMCFRGILGRCKTAIPYINCTNSQIKQLCRLNC